LHDRNAVEPPRTAGCPGKFFPFPVILENRNGREKLKTVEA